MKTQLDMAQRMVLTPLSSLVANYANEPALNQAGRVLMNISGGATDQALIDLTRTRIRLEGLQSYAIVTTLLMNAALRIFSCTPKTLKTKETVDNIAKIIFAFNILVTVITGSYTTITFTLLGVYSKTALGLGRDDKFLEFFERTAYNRKSAFQSFFASIITFQCSFILSLFLNYENRFRWVISSFAIALSFLFWWKWSSIVYTAGHVLFS